jgi:hypothetical protein
VDWRRVGWLAWWMERRMEGDLQGERTEGGGENRREKRRRHVCAGGWEKGGIVGISQSARSKGIKANTRRGPPYRQCSRSRAVSEGSAECFSNDTTTRSESSIVHNPTQYLHIAAVSVSSRARWFLTSLPILPQPSLSYCVLSVFGWTVSCCAVVRSGPVAEARSAYTVLFVDGNVNVNEGMLTTACCLSWAFMVG